MTHLRVMGNEAAGEGGGLHFRDGSPTVRDIIVTENHADTGGGGIRYTGGSVRLENMVVVSNWRVLVALVFLSTMQMAPL